MAWFNDIFSRKKKKEEESTAPSSSSRVQDAVQNLYQQAAASQQAAAQADLDVARVSNQRVQNAAKDIYSAYARQQEEAAREKERQDRERIARQRELEQQRQEQEAARLEQERAAREEQQKRLAEATQNIYSAVVRNQERKTGTERAANENQANLYSNIAKDMGTARNLYQKQLAGTDVAAEQYQKIYTDPIRERAGERESSLTAGDPTKGVGAFGVIALRKDYPQMSRPRTDTGDELYDYINGLNDERQRQQGYAMQRGAESGMEKYTLMTDEERGVYNYMYNTQGPEAASNYLQRLEPELNAQWRAGETKWNQDMATEDAGNAALYSLATVAAQPVRTLEGAAALAEDTIRTATGQGIDPNSELRRKSQLTRGIRESIAGELEENPGLVGTMIDNDTAYQIEKARADWAQRNPYASEEENPFFAIDDTDPTSTGAATAFLYNSAMSAMDSAMNSVTARGLGSAVGLSDDLLMKATNVLGAALMSNEVASLEVAENKNKGYSDEGALLLGLVRGGVEFASEMIGGEWAIKNIKANPLSFLNAVVLNMVPEGMEEVMSDAMNGGINLLMDALFGTEESGFPKLVQHYKEDGTDWQKEHPQMAAMLAILGEEGLSFLGGALATVGTTGTQYTTNIASINSAARQMNTTQEEVVKLMEKYGTDNPGEIASIAELTDATSVEDFTQKMDAIRASQREVDNAEKEAAETADVAKETSPVAEEAQQTEPEAEEAAPKTLNEAIQQARERQRQLGWQDQYDMVAAFISPNGEPVVWDNDTTHEYVAQGLPDRDSWHDTYGAIAQGYIRVKQNEGIELTADKGQLSPQQAREIRKLVDSFTGNTFRVDLDSDRMDIQNTVSALEFEGADIDGRKIVDAINRQIREIQRQNQLTQQQYAEQAAAQAQVEQSTPADRKQQQFDLIQQSNPMRDDIHTGIRDMDEIRTFDEALDDDGIGEGDAGMTPDITPEIIEKARQTGEITVYSSKPIEAGSFVTPSRMEAESYAGSGKIYSQTVSTGDVAWIDSLQGQYAPVQETATQPAQAQTEPGLTAEATTQEGIQETGNQTYRAEGEDGEYEILQGPEGEVTVRRLADGKTGDPSGNIYILATSIPLLQNMESVYSVKGNEIPTTEKSGSNNILKFFKSIGNKVFRNGLGEVSLDKYGAKATATKQHHPTKAKYMAVAAVPSVIQNGRLIHSEFHNGKQSYMYAAPVNFMGKPVYVAAIVHEVIQDGKPTNKYYLDEIVDIDGYRFNIENKEAPQGPKYGATTNSGATESPTVLPANSITPTAEESNTENTTESQQQKEAGDLRRQLAQAEQEYMDHSQANDTEYDYRAQMDKIDGLRRQIQENTEQTEQQTVNENADNVNEKNDNVNQTVEALKREGKVTNPTYDVDKYGDPHPERGEMGDDGVRICKDSDALEAELTDFYAGKIRNDTGEYMARIRRKNEGGYLLTINRDGKRDLSRTFGSPGEAAAFASSYIDSQTKARTDAELDQNKSAPVPQQTAVEAAMTGTVQDEAARQKKNKAAELGTQALRERIRKADEEIKALRRLEKTTGLTDTQKEHMADVRETLETLNDELTSRKGRAKEKKEKVEVKGNKPTQSIADTRRNLMNKFSIPEGRRTEVGNEIQQRLDEMIREGSVTEESRRALFDTLIDAGVVPKQADSTLHEIRNDLANRRIYVSEKERADLGENWEGLRKRAWGDRIFLTNNPTDTKIDAVNMELADVYGEKMFPTDIAVSDMLENMLDLAAKGRTTQQSLSEAISDEAHYTGATTDEIYDEMFRDMDAQLKAFGEKAGLEVDLKDRTATMLATERKRWEERMDKQSQRRRESEIREKTMKAIKRLVKLRGKADPDVRTEIDAALKDIDTHARQLTISGLEDLQELARVYEQAKEAAGYQGPDNPGNFISNPYVEEKLGRLSKMHINDMDIQDVIELGRVVQGLENTVKTQNKMLSEEFDQGVKETATAVNQEVQQAKGAKPGIAQKWFKEEMLSPRRFLNMLGGWKDGAMAKLADSLENGQTRMLDFQRRAVQSMDPFMKDKKNKQWLKTASGKNAKWYQYSVANGLANDGSGITGQTIEITPMMKVSLYLASLNEDNLRHIQTGGLVIPDKDLYVKGDVREAYKQGTKVKMQPEAVRAIASTLTPEEKTFASYLQKFFNTQSKDAINEVSMQLDGYERADVDQYFPIESYDAYLKSDPANKARSQTVEGIGSINNERVHAGNPIVLRDAYDTFMDQVDNVSRYYGYAIPVRDFNAINNHVFHEEGNAFAGSVKDTINHKWGSGAEDYITKMLQDIQMPGGAKSDRLSRGLSRLRSNLAGANLTLNPSVAASQLASYPAAAQSVGIKGLVGGLTAERRLSDVSENQIDMAQMASYPGAAQVVGWDALAAGLTTNPVDEKLVEKYTPLLWYRSQGYSTQEIGDAIAADKKNAAQKLLASKALNWIQGMDRLATKRLWAAAEYKVRKDNPDLKPGSRELIDSGMDPYYKEVAKVYNRAIYDTQPNYTDMERAQILRSDSDLTKFLTMYKTVPLQYYNMMVEAAGKLQAARQSGNATQIANASKYALNTVAGLMAANGIYDVIKAAFKGLKGKDDDYRDEEGNLTIDSVLKQLGKDFMETNAGSIIGGAEAMSIAESMVTGKKWTAPEVSALAGVEDTINDIRNVWPAISDGDAQKAAKALKATATDLSAMLGLPVRNVETYLLSGIRWASPETALAYDNIFGGISKSDLKGMDQNVAGTAANMIMKNRTGVNLERASTDELARLYAAGFSDAIPNATPDSFTYGGNEVKVKDKKAYSKAWGDVVSDNLEELTSSKEYQDADDKAKMSMVRKLYQYATVQARMGADAEYAPEKSDSTYGWTLKADEAKDAGIDLATYISAYTTLNDMKSDKNAMGATTVSAKSKKVAYIDSLPIDSEQKDLLYSQQYDSGLEMTPWHSGIDAQTAFTDSKVVADAGTQQTVMQSNLDSLQTSDYYINATAEEKKDLINKLQKYAETQGKKKTDPSYRGAGWTSWAEQATKEGMTLPEALSYVQQIDSITADYDEYGDAISGTKKEKTIEYIDSLNTSDAKKELLYRLANLDGSPVDYRTKKQTVEKYQKDLQKSSLYRSGTKEEQKAMDKRLDQYALVQAMKAKDPKYTATGTSYGWTEWADQAVKAGMTMPEAIGYMTKVKSIKSDYDQYGKAISGTKKENTLKYIDSLDVSDTYKNLLYKAAGYDEDAEDLRTKKTIVEDNRAGLVGSDQYKTASAEDQAAMLQKLEDYAKVQAMKKSDPNYSPAGTSYAWTEWADQAVKGGMTLPEAIGYAQQVKGIKADYDEYGRAISGTKKEKTLEYIDSLNLPDKKEELLYKLAGLDSDGPAVDYSTRKKVLKQNKDALLSSDAYKSASAKDQKTMLKKLNEYALVQGMKKADKNYSAESTSYNWTLWADQAVKGGININDAITYMTALNGMSADKDKYGKSITGSKKDKVCAYIESIPGLTTEQKDILYLYLYKENSLKYTPWHGYTGKKKSRRGGGRRRKAAKATSIKPVGQLAKGYDTSIDISTLFGTPAQKSGKSGDANAEDDLRELLEKYGDNFLAAAMAAGSRPKARTKVDFKL